MLRGSIAAGTSGEALAVIDSLDFAAIQGHFRVVQHIHKTRHRFRRRGACLAALPARSAVPLNFPP